MVFVSRKEAGESLGLYLQEKQIQADWVLGLPRGGVVVAERVAQSLHLPLNILVVRKIGHPRHREYAVGALAEGGVVVLDRGAIETTHVLPAELEEVVEEEKARLTEYLSKFEHPTPAELAGKKVILVDDGLATGATMEAAVLSARQKRADLIVVAVPVASDNAFARLQPVADQVLALWVDPAFEAVGQYYEHFSQTTDEEVLELLKKGH